MNLNWWKYFVVIILFGAVSNLPFWAHSPGWQYNLGFIAAFAAILISREDRHAG